jgi:two-component system, OmpR family, KDP operon response regulator KdpE
MNQPKQRILVVEDEPQLRRFEVTTLQREGFDVYDAANLERGLIEAGTRRPDMVVLDLGLPDGDGVDLIRQLRGWSDAPVIVVSARTDEADKVQALDAGADNYLVSPSAWQSFWRACERTSGAERQPRVGTVRSSSSAT